MPDQVLAELRTTVSMSGAPDGQLMADVYLSPSPVIGLRADVDLNNVTGAQSLPAPLVVQEVGFRVYLDGVLQDRGQLFGSISVEESESGTTWTLGAPVSGTSPSGSVSPFGSPFAYLGAQPGLRSVTVVGVYKSGGLTYEVPLVTNGIADSSTRGDGGGPAVDSIVGVDAVGRYDRKKVTLQLPAGHGLQRGRVIKRLAILAGFPSSSVAISDGGQMRKELQLDDGEWLPLARELALIDQRGIAPDRDGLLRSFCLEPTLAQTAERVITEAHIIAGSGGVTGRGDVPTSIEITGTEQILRDECGLRTEISATESFADYAPLGSRWKQQSNGALIDQGVFTPLTEFQLVTRVTTTREFNCDDLMSENIVTERWFRPLAWRYTIAQNTAGSIVAGQYNANVHVDDVAVQDDGNQAHVWSTERFVVVADDLTTYSYDDRGFLLEVKTLRRGYRQTLAGLKDRTSPATVWESTNFGVDGANPKVNGDGTGVTGNEVFYYSTDPRERETVTYDVTDDGFIQAETSTLELWTHRPGWAAIGGDQFLYTKGEVESKDKTDVFVESRVDTSVYTSLGESTVQVVRSRDDKVTGKLEQDIETSDGHLPAATSRNSITPSGIYDDEAEEALATAASRYEQREIVAECSSTALLATKVTNEVKSSNPWAETQAELSRLACFMLRRDSALTVRWMMAGDLLTRRGHLVHLRIAPLRLDHDVYVTRVRVSQASIKAPVITDIEGRIYVA